MLCKSGRHEWINPSDAEKCCNGYERRTIIGDVRECDTIGSYLLPGGIPFGYKWVKKEDNEE